MSNKLSSKMVPVILHHSYVIESCGRVGGTLKPRLNPLITTMQTLAPNAITNARWQRLYQKDFGFVFVQWEELETCCLSFSLPVEKCLVKLLITHRNLKQDEQPQLQTNNYKLSKHSQAKKVGSH